MAILVIDPRTCPTAARGAPKQVFFDSPNYHVWVHGPDSPGDKGPMHKHSADETFFCVRGAATFHFTEQASAKVTAGMMIIIPKDHFYQIECTGAEKTLMFGTRAQPFDKPRLSEKGEVVDKKSRWAAGANY